MRPATSMAAAASIRQCAPGMRREILRALARHPGGLTDEALAKYTGINPDTLRPRRVELRAANAIRLAAKVGTTSKGRKAQMWMLA